MLNLLYGVSSSRREFESLVKYLTAFVRSRIGIPFAAVGILDGCSLEAHRDSHNLRGSLNIVIPLTQGGFCGLRTRTAVILLLSGRSVPKGPEFLSRAVSFDLVTEFLCFLLICGTLQRLPSTAV